MSHLSSATNEAVAASSITVARPAGAGAAHILVASVWADTWNTGGMTASAGWTRIVSVNHTAYSASESSLFWAPGDVAALTFNVAAGAGSGDIRAVVSAFAGRNLGAPIGDVQSAESTAATISVPSMSVSAGDDVFATWADFQANLTGGITGGAPGGYTDRINDATPNTMHVAGATAEGLSAGTTGVLSRACGNFTAKIATGVVLKAAGGATSLDMNALTY